MADRPILFSGEMVRAILDGRKTQTRRVVKPQPDFVANYYEPEKKRAAYKGGSVNPGLLRCPYGRPGDTLWVRETWASHKYMDDTKPSEFSIGAQMLPVWYRADGVQSNLRWASREPGKWRPSIFMPRWASRITLRVINVRVERVQDISETDAKAEGAKPWPDVGVGPHYKSPFRNLWDSINAKRGYAWSDNPWVWVVEFEQVVP